MAHNPVQYIYTYQEYKGETYRVEIRVEVDRIAGYLTAKALRNRTKQSRVYGAQARAKLAKRKNHVDDIDAAVEG